MKIHRKQKSANGFSLLEVILAIALSVVVIYLVAAGVDFHLRQLTTRKANVQEAQLARAVLRRISDDLRAVVVERGIDFSSLTEANVDAPALNEAAEDSTAEDSTAEEIISSTIPEVPGIYGTATDLQVDISRIPRYEEYAYAANVDDTASMTTISDVKTVSYFLIGSQQNAGSISTSRTNVENIDTLGLPPDQPLQGLGRRMTDRSVSRFALQNANFSYLDQQAELIAPEVSLIEFRYFDGNQWTLEWNTERRGGIPMAIEITLMLSDPEQRERGEPINQTSLAWIENADRVFRLIVHLPPSEVLPPVDEQTETAQ